MPKYEDSYPHGISEVLNKCRTIEEKNKTLLELCGTSEDEWKENLNNLSVYFTQLKQNLDKNHEIFATLIRKLSENHLITFSLDSANKILEKVDLANPTSRFEESLTTQACKPDFDFTKAFGAWRVENIQQLDALEELRNKPEVVISIALKKQRQEAIQAVIKELFADNHPYAENQNAYSEQLRKMEQPALISELVKLQHLATQQAQIPEKENAQDFVNSRLQQIETLLQIKLPVDESILAKIEIQDEIKDALDQASKFYLAHKNEFNDEDVHFHFLLHLWHIESLKAKEKKLQEQEEVLKQKNEFSNFNILEMLMTELGEVKLTPFEELYIHLQSDIEKLQEQLRLQNAAILTRIGELKSVESRLNQIMQLPKLVRMQYKDTKLSLRVHHERLLTAFYSEIKQYTVSLASDFNQITLEELLRLNHIDFKNILPHFNLNATLPKIFEHKIIKINQILLKHINHEDPFWKPLYQEISAHPEQCHDEALKALCHDNYVWSATRWKKVEPVIRKTWAALKRKNHDDDVKTLNRNDFFNFYSCYYEPHELLGQTEKQFNAITWLEERSTYLSHFLSALYLPNENPASVTPDELLHRIEKRYVKHITSCEKLAGTLLLKFNNLISGKFSPLYKNIENNNAAMHEISLLSQETELLKAELTATKQQLNTASTPINLISSSLLSFSSKVKYGLCHPALQSYHQPLNQNFEAIKQEALETNERIESHNKALVALDIFKKLFTEMNEVHSLNCDLQTTHPLTYFEFLQTLESKLTLITDRYNAIGLIDAANKLSNDVILQYTIQRDLLKNEIEKSYQRLARLCQHFELSLQKNSRKEECALNTNIVGTTHLPIAIQENIVIPSTAQRIKFLNEQIAEIQTVLQQSISQRRWAIDLLNKSVKEFKIFIACYEWLSKTECRLGNFEKLNVLQKLDECIVKCCEKKLGLIDQVSSIEAHSKRNLIYEAFCKSIKFIFTWSVSYFGNQKLLRVQAAETLGKVVKMPPASFWKPACRGEVEPINLGSSISCLRA